MCEKCYEQIKLVGVDETFGCLYESVRKIEKQVAQMRKESHYHGDELQPPTITQPEIVRGTVFNNHFFPDDSVKPISKKSTMRTEEEIREVYDTLKKDMANIAKEHTYENMSKLSWFQWVLGEDK